MPETPDNHLHHIKQRLGEELNYFRREQHLSLYDISQRSGLPINYLDSLELGQTDANLHTLVKLVQALNKHLRIEIID